MLKMMFGFEGTPVAVRVLDHASDAAKVVFKAADPYAGPALCKVLGLAALGQWKGSQYHITEVGRSAFAEALPKLATVASDALIDAVQAAMLKAQPAANLADVLPETLDDGTVVPKLPALQKCGECGTKDNVHWGFCSQSAQNKH